MSDRPIMQRWLTFFLSMLCIMAQTPVHADDLEGCRSEQDCARNALRRGEVRPLEEVLGAARQTVPGDVIEVELDREDGRWVYEVTVLQEDGRRREMEIDGKTLTILEIE